jgi:hypothetical protein
MCLRQSHAKPAQSLQYRRPMLNILKPNCNYVPPPSASNNSTLIFMRFARFSLQPDIISLNNVNNLIFVTVKRGVFPAVKTSFSFKCLMSTHNMVTCLRLKWTVIYNSSQCLRRCVSFIRYKKSSWHTLRAHVQASSSTENSAHILNYKWRIGSIKHCNKCWTSSKLPKLVRSKLGFNYTLHL